MRQTQLILGDFPFTVSIAEYDRLSRLPVAGRQARNLWFNQSFPNQITRSDINRAI